MENHLHLNELVFIGLQPRGVQVSKMMVDNIQHLYPGEQVAYGILDITFYRDDVRQEFHVANKTEIPFSIEGKKVILIDDVLYTGRTIRAALDALQDFGRPQKVELCVLVDRRFNRELPIQPDYFGKAIDTLVSQKVKVEWDKEQVILY
jgi:pyrimidine operon attenuation protein/uracil phosphoribosyltransferase